jgi:hypothetical protein
MLHTLNIKQSQKSVLRTLSEDPELEVIYGRFLAAFSALVLHIDSMGYHEELYDELICCAFIHYEKTRPKM